MQHLARVKSGAHLVRCVLQLPLTGTGSRRCFGRARQPSIAALDTPPWQPPNRAAPQQPGQRTNAITIVKDRLCAFKDRNRGRLPGGGQAEGHAQPREQVQLQRQQQQQQQQEEQQQGQQQAQVSECRCNKRAAGRPTQPGVGGQQQELVRVQQSCCWAP
jgi:hypothetical protein